MQTSAPARSVLSKTVLGPVLIAIILACSGPAARAQAAIAPGDPVRGKVQFGPCTQCHAVSAGAPNMAGSNLHGVIGKRAGTNDPTFPYSTALKSSGIVWNDATLNTWLTDPAEMVHHTAMMFIGIPKAQTRANIIAYLEKATR